MDAAVAFFGRHGDDTLTDAAQRLRGECDAFVTAAANLLPAPADIAALNFRLSKMQPVADRAKALIKDIDGVTKLLQKAHESLVAKGEKPADGKKLLATVADARVALTGDPAVQLVVTGSLKRFRYFEGQAHWLLSRFPDGRLRDVQGLVKLVDHAELAANDYSLTPGRYVGVAPEVEDDGFDFEEALREIHLELDGLNAEAAELAEVIAKNFEELLG
jgi:type I restriction enzyme M protein